MKHTRKKRAQKKRKTRKNRFNTKDYKSKDGMLTSIWGPGLWHFLHTISFNYPNEPSKEHKRHYHDFMKMLEHILPCRYCRENYKKNITDCPLTKEVFESRHTFSKYVYDLHEHINKMLGKKSNLSFEDVRERYEHFRSRCDKEMERKEIENKKKENGCTHPLKGKKPRCVLNIIAATNTKKNSIEIDPTLGFH